MKHTDTAHKQRNWPLVFVSSILILIGLILLTLSIVYAINLGWRSLLYGTIGLSTISFSVTAIVENDPSWILLDLILPY